MFVVDIKKKKKIEEKTLFLMQSIGKVFLEYPGFYFSWKKLPITIAINNTTSDSKFFRFSLQRESQPLVSLHFDKKKNFFLNNEII